MATYFHGNSEIQGGDGLQTLILMNPAYVGYAETQPQPQPHPQSLSRPQPENYFFLNPSTAGTALNTTNLTHAPRSQTQHFIGIPLQATTVTPSSQDFSAIHGFLPLAQYNMYNPVDLTAARVVTHPQQGLSLSLSSQQPEHGSFRSECEGPSQALAPVISPTRQDDVRVSHGSSSSASGISNGINGMQIVLLSSKYLKAARDLLDEVVNVGRGVKDAVSGKGTNGETKALLDSSATVDGPSGRNTSTKLGAEVNTAERQEIQTKKAKLVNMLDEVEQRYRQYQQRMEAVISWFEQAAGIDSAKTYTALALQTISKQFRCLKEAILGQIRAASKSLGEEECLGGKIEGSKLKFFDNQIRQQRALQQLGIIQNNAWRPQRGLPERSVSILRAWLFEHFLHPYPKDSDKILLAKQTGLTRSQVSNWFINARVRLWKPMVEEMYMEEMKEHEHKRSEGKTSEREQTEGATSKSNDTREKLSGSENQNRSIKQDNTTKQKISPTVLNSGFDLGGSSKKESIAEVSPRKPGGNEMLHSPRTLQPIHMDTKPAEANNEQDSIKFGNERQNGDGFTLMGASANFIGGFGSYPMVEIGRFSSEQFPGTYSGNGVSLTLGLQHCENISMSGTHQTFLPNQNIQLGAGLGVAEPNGITASVFSSHKCV